MTCRLRGLLAVLAPLAAFGVCLWPVYRGEWLAMRELYRLSMSLEILRPTGRFWGQLGGLDIPSHSDTFRVLMRLGSLGLTLVPLVTVSLLLWYWIRIARPWNARRWATVRRAAALGLAAAGVVALSEGLVERHVKDLVFGLGTSAGCEYISISVLWVGPDGPFVDGRWAWLFNPLYTHGHWVTTHTGAFAIAWAAFVLLGRRDPRPRLGQCPACGYPLDQLRACPECGRGPAR